MNKAYLLLPTLVLAGCQSQHLALGPVSSSVLAAPAGPADSATALVVLRAPGAAVLPAGSLPSRPAPARRHRPAPAATVLPTLTVASAPLAPARPRLLQRLALRRLATAGPAHTAENGLGSIALFFIAIVLAALAGLAALFALIPGVSFWGGLGLAVGALVVIGLLYKLLSGGKKPVKATAK